MSRICLTWGNNKARQRRQWTRRTLHQRRSCQGTWGRTDFPRLFGHPSIHTSRYISKSVRQCPAWKNQHFKPGCSKLRAPTWMGRRLVEWLGQVVFDLTPWRCRWASEWGLSNNDRLLRTPELRTTTELLWEIFRNNSVIKKKWLRNLSSPLGSLRTSKSGIACKEAIMRWC